MNPQINLLIAAEHSKDLRKQAAEARRARRVRHDQRAAHRGRR
jgi:hypothetical protein